MKLWKGISIVFVIFVLFGLNKIHAQSTKSPQPIKILNNYGSIPFEDGKTVIAEVKFIGLDSDYEEYDETIGKQLPESDCWKLLRDNRATINVEDKFYGGKVSKVVKLLREWLASNGYDRAEIIALGEKLPRNQMKLIFAIKRGELARVSEIIFDGNVNISNEEFVADFKQCINNGWEIFDSRKYQYITQKCSRALMFSKGFFQAKINNINRRLVDNNYVVTIGVHEGIRYRIGEIKIKGAKVFTEKEILEMFGQKEGDVANGKLLQDFFYEKLKRSYADKGFILYNSEFDPDFVEPVAEDLDGIVNIKGEIDEGNVFKIRKIEFVGIDKETASALKESFSLRDGEIFNQSKFEEGIKKINEMKEFDFVDKDVDVEIRTDEDASDLDLVIKVSKIEQ